MVDIDRIKYAFISIAVVSLILVGIPGNILVIAAVKKKRSLRSTTNYLLANVAAADLLTTAFGFLCIIAFKVKPSHKMAGDVMCKLISYNVPVTSACASITTLTVLAIERYQAVIYPMRNSFKLRESTAKYAVALIWLTSFVITIPLYLYNHYNPTRQRCSQPSEQTIRAYLNILSLIITIPPFLVFMFCYGRITKELYFKKSVGPKNIAIAEEASMKRKLVKTSLTVTTVFAVCCIPFSLCFVFECDDTAAVITAACFVFDSAVNPLLYSFQSANFRQAFRELLSSCCKGDHVGKVKPSVRSTRMTTRTL